jgi:lipoate-protein ligase A
MRRFLIMEQTKLTRQMIEFYKTTFDNTFNATMILQEQTERMVGLFLEQSPWFPKEGKEAVSEWVKTYKKGRDAYKISVDESYKKVKEYFVNADKGEKTKAGK